MNCEQCNNHLSALIDDELTVAQRDEVRRHLDACPACRDALEDLRNVDATLADGLVIPPHAIDRAVTAVANPARLPADQGWTQRFGFWSVIAAVAASIAIALTILPDRGAPPEAPRATVAGRLVRATGPIEVLDPGANQWQQFESDMEFVSGARVRTPEHVTCEIETSDKAMLRVDQAAELVMHSPDHVEVIRGKVWCRTSDTKPIRVDTAAPLLDAPGAFMMTCPSNSEFQWTVQENESVVQSLTESETLWTGTDFRCPVGPGDRVAVDTQQNVKRSKPDAPSAKIWQLPLLAISGKPQDELDAVVEPVLIRIGRTKAGFLDERQILQLGPRGAVPLLAYVQSERSRSQPDVRHEAMRIAADLADASATTRLRELALDGDATVAKMADAALRRIEKP